MSGIHTPADTIHRRVSYSNNAIVNLLVQQNFPDSVNVPEKPGSELTGVCSGGADVALIEAKVMMASLLNRPRGCESVSFNLIPYRGSAYAMAMGSSRQAASTAHALRSEITGLAKEGTLDQLYRKWLLETTDETRIIMELQQVRQRLWLLCWGMGGLAAMVLGLIWHVCRKHLAREATKSAYEFVSAILDTAGGMVLICDRHGRIVRVNRACEGTTGKTLDEIRGKTPWDVFVPPSERGAVQALFEQLGASQAGSAAHITHEHHWRTIDGERLYSWSKTVLLNDSRQVEYIIATGVDITKREAMEERLGYEAAHDPLTGLANRRHFMGATHVAVEAARTGDSGFSVCLADLDRFKLINDSFGHSAGDEVLTCFARLLREAAGSDSLAGRLGGDEFCLLLPGSSGLAEIERIRRAMEEKEFHAGGKPFRVTATFGFARWNDSMRAADDLLHAADAALYRAKRQGGNRMELPEAEVLLTRY